MLLLEVLELESGDVGDDVEEVHLALLLPLSSESSWSHVVEVLQPLEVADGDTTGVNEDIREEDNSLLGEDLLSSDCGGTICSLRDHLALELVSVVLVHSLLERSRNEHVALLVDGILFLEGLAGGWAQKE